MKKIFNVGDKITAFDSDEWRKTGDIGNNDIFFKSAEVIEVRLGGNPLEWLADIRFDDGGRESKGHFQRILTQNIK